MNRFYTVPACLLAAMPFCSTQTQDAVSQRPNLLVVMADQFRGDAFGFRGKEAVKTPCFDRFASQAVVFTQAASSYPVSSPARGMFLSGAYPHVNGVLTNCQSQSATQDVELRQNLTCWSDVLKHEGYQTAYIGKWHLDKPMKPYVDCANNRGAMAWNEWCPPERRHGFDYWTAYGTYDNHLRPLYWSRDAGRDGFYYVDQWGPEYEANLAIQYLDSIRGSDKPFAMMVSMNPPHTGYELVPERYKELYRDLNVDSIAASLPQLQGQPKFVKLFKESLPNYYACITGVDEQFGRIVEALKRNGQYDHTIVVFVSDHGDSMGLHENIGKNIFYEEAVRIPFLLAYGDRIAPRVDNDLLISIEDFCPTILSLLGLKDRIPSTVQARDLSEQMKGSREQMPDGQLYMRYSAVDETGTNVDTGTRGYRTQRYTYAVRFERGKVVDRFLFDRQKDPTQLENLVEKQPEVADDLHGRMKKRLDEIHDPAAVFL